MAKKQTLQGKNPAELTEMLSKERGELRTLRFAAAGARPKDSSAPRKSRAQVARILTELHARRNIAAMEAALPVEEAKTETKTKSA